MFIGSLYLKKFAALCDFFYACSNILYQIFSNITSTLFSSAGFNAVSEHIDHVGKMSVSGYSDR